MSKLLISLLLFINISFCYIKNKDGIRVFEKDEDITVRLGEEFAIKFTHTPGKGEGWMFLNKAETNTTLKFLKNSYDAKTKFAPIGGPENIYYHFLPIQRTNETVTLKFNLNTLHGFLTPETLVEVNIQ